MDKQTGGAGGVDKKLDETDLLVMEILGKDSPVIKGFGLPDSLGIVRNQENTLVTDHCVSPTSEKVNVIKEHNTCPNDVPANTINQLCTTTTQASTSTTRPTSQAPGKRVIVQLSDVTKEQEILKKRKLQLEVRKLEIEVWNRENELGIKHTNLTEHIETLNNLNANEELLGKQLLVLDNSNYAINDDGTITEL